MRIYILTCIDDEGRLAYAEPRTSYGEAFDMMRADYEKERETFINNENLCGIRDYIHAYEASTGSEENYYMWKITTSEL